MYDDDSFSFTDLFSLLSCIYKSVLVTYGGFCDDGSHQLEEKTSKLHKFMLKKMTIMINQFNMDSRPVNCDEPQPVCWSFIM